MANEGINGRLIVKVATGLGTIPIEGAQIFVVPYQKEDMNEGDTYSLRTNADGLTSVIDLSAPSRSISLSPSDEGMPYSEYLLTVRKDGYRTVEIVGIPIFDGITSLQSVNLLPLSEDEYVTGDKTTQVFFGNDGYNNLRNDSEDTETEELL